MKKVTVYTDGACSGNPGPGGWSAILVCGQFTKELSGGKERTTNNRMELFAACEALIALKEPCDVTLYSDSQYLVDSMSTGRVKKWALKKWYTSNGPVKNKDLWESLLTLCDTHKVQFVKVKGHAGHEFNERCDKLAKAAIPVVDTDGMDPVQEAVYLDDICNYLVDACINDVINKVNELDEATAKDCLKRMVYRVQDAIKIVNEEIPA